MKISFEFNTKEKVAAINMLEELRLSSLDFNKEELVEIEEKFANAHLNFVQLEVDGNDAVAVLNAAKKLIHIYDMYNHSLNIIKDEMPHHPIFKS